MILRKVHLDAMTRAAEEAFVDRLVEHTGATRAHVEQGIDRAYGEELVSERDIAAFVTKWVSDGDR